MTGATGGGLVTRVRTVAVTGSTQTDLLAAARAGAPEGEVLLADSQTAGRGRHGRSWHAPPRSGLTFSVLLRPGDGVPAERWPLLTLVAGLAVVHGVRAAVGDRAGLAGLGLKWPNDLVVPVVPDSAGAPADRKLAGVLAERAGSAVVLGVGVNVAQRPEELPVESATSLHLCGIDDVPRAVLLDAVLSGLRTRYDAWRAVGGDPVELLADYRAACLTLGRRVRVGGRGDEVVGTAVDVDGLGRLVVDAAAGRHRVALVEVTHLRPA